MKRRGFTLIELLVVIAIIAILMARLVPAVQKVPHGGADTMRQQFEATRAGSENYHSSFKKLPSGSFSPNNLYGPSALAMLLPYLDQNALGDKLQTELTANWASGNSDDGSGVTAWDQAGRTRLTVLLCPADPQVATQMTEFGWTNYFPNHGTWVMLTNHWDGVFGPNAVVTGSVPAAPFVKFTDITDGTSNTAAFAEVCRGPDDSSTPRSNRTDCFEVTGTPPTTTATAARNFFLAQNSQTAGFAGGWSPPWRWRGCPWREGSIWRTGYNHLLPPNAACWRPNSDWWQLVSPASSFHTGGVNVCFADGSVHFVSESINVDTWTAIGSRAGNEAVDLSSIN